MNMLNLERCHVNNVMKRGQRVAQSGSSGYLFFTKNCVKEDGTTANLDLRSGYVFSKGGPPVGGADDF